MNGSQRGFGFGVDAGFDDNAGSVQAGFDIASSQAGFDVGADAGFDTGLGFDAEGGFDDASLGVDYDAGF